MNEPRVHQLTPGNLWRISRDKGDELLLIVGSGSDGRSVIWKMSCDAAVRGRIIAAEKPGSLESYPGNSVTDTGMIITYFDNRLLNVLESQNGTYVGTTFRPKLEVGRSYASLYGVKKLTSVVRYSPGIYTFLDSEGRRYFQYGIRAQQHYVNPISRHLLMETTSTIAKFNVQSDPPPGKLIAMHKGPSHLPGVLYDSKLMNYAAKLI